MYVLIGAIDFPMTIFELFSFKKGRRLFYYCPLLKTRKKYYIQRDRIYKSLYKIQESTEQGSRYSNPACKRTGKDTKSPY